MNSGGTGGELPAGGKNEISSLHLMCAAWICDLEQVRIPSENIQSVSSHTIKLLADITRTNQIDSGSEEKFLPTRQESSSVHSSNFRHTDIYFLKAGVEGGGMKESCHITCTCLCASSLVAVIAPDRSISVHSGSEHVPQSDRLNRQRRNPD